MGTRETHVHGTNLLCKHTPVIFVYFQRRIHINLGETEKSEFHCTGVNRISCSSQSRVVGGWVVVGDGQVMSDYKVITKPQLMYRQNWKLPLITFSVHGRLETGELFNRKYFNRL